MDDEAIRRCKAGDAGAFTDLVGRYQDVAFRTAYLITGNAADAEDAAQAGFVKAWFALSRFREGAPFRPWLLTIVANEARNRRTRSGRHPNADIAPLEPLLADTSGQEPERIVLDRDRAEQVRAALGRLSEDDRVAIGMRYFLDLNEADMAATLGCRPGTVKSRLSRAMGRLRAILQEGGFDD